VSAPYQASLKHGVKSTFDLDGSAIQPVTTSCLYDDTAMRRRKFAVTACVEPPRRILLYCCGE
jgi:hypothetical protein